MSTVENELVGKAGKLSPADVDFCEKETQKIADLSPKMFAKVFSVLYIVDLLGAEKAGKIRIARLKMNRKPKVKAVESLVETILEVGAQIMCVIIPATVAVRFGFAVTDFEGNPIPENELSRNAGIEIQPSTNGPCVASMLMTTMPGGFA